MRCRKRPCTRSLFPLGETVKTDVRSLAREAGFANHDKKDSTGICFIGERRFTEFLGKLPARPAGRDPDAGGPGLGRHNGLMYYTLGQRQGIGIGGRAAPMSPPGTWRRRTWCATCWWWCRGTTIRGCCIRP